MLTIELLKGGYLFKEGNGKDFLVNFNSEPMPFNPRLKFDAAKTYADLPAVSEVYDMCQKLHYDPEQTIDTMLKVYHRARLFRCSYLKDKELTIGFVGHRGSGKSASATGLIGIDWLLCPGYRVWANVPIAVKVKCFDAEKIYQSEPLPKLELLELDESFQNGVVFVDEVNMEVAESSRFMSATNLGFSNMLQQIRKRQISVVWTAQNWNSVDPRLKWQSDYVIWCEDAFFHKSHSRMGWRSHWSVMDSSGMSGIFKLEDEMKMHYLMEHKIAEMTFYMRPWWNAYDTRQLQGQGEYGLKKLQKQRLSEKEYGVEPQETNLDAFVLRVESQNIGKLYKHEVWQQNDLTNNRAEQTAIGYAFKKHGWKDGRDSKGRYWYKEAAEVANI